MEFTDHDLVYAMASLTIVILLFFRHEHRKLDDLLERRQISRPAYGTKARQLRVFAVGMTIVLGIGAFIVMQFATKT